MEKEQILNELKDTISQNIKSELEAQLKDAIAKINPAPSPDEEAINEAVKENKFKTFGEQLIAIHKFRTSGITDNRLIYVDSNRKLHSVEKALAEGTDSSGGFLLADEFRAELLQLSLERSIIRPNGAMTIPMSSDKLSFPRVDDSTHASSVFGGWIAYWSSEAATIQHSQPKIGQATLSVNDLTGYTQASNNLLADSAISLEPFLRRGIAESVAWFEDLAFIRGTGSGQPLGILNAGALVSVTRQNTSRVFAFDIYNMYSRMLPGSHDRAIWILNPGVLPDILGLVAENAAPAATAGTPLFTRNIVDPVAKTILGRPYFISEKMSALGDAGDIGFFDLAYYLIGDRQPLTIDVSEHVAFLQNSTAWRFVERADGQPWLSTYMTPYKGTNYLSPFVALAATS